MKPAPLISVVVITYRSSDYVLETLESIRKQTYENIELIVADDGSPDGTVDICRQWLSAHGDRFIKATLVSDGTNLGIAGNCNRGLARAGGEWVKIIAGDDVLLEDCIADNVAFVATDDRFAVVFSDMYRIDARSARIGLMRPHGPFFGYGSAKQLFFLLNKNFLPAPSAFLRRAILEEAGGFDMNYPMMEDYPLWIKLLRDGCVFGYLEKTTVCYRSHEQSASNDWSRLNPVYFRCLMDYDRQVRLPMARRISGYLFVKIWIDRIYIRLLVLHPKRLRLVYPLAWAWVKLQYMVDLLAFPDNRDPVKKGLWFN